MGADQTFRPPATATPAVEAPASSTSAPRDRTFQANVAGGGGNAYAASLAAPGQEAAAPAEETPGKPGMLDWAGAVLGSKHLRTMLGPTAKGVQWDDREKGANRMEVDIWGKDEVRVPKLRIASINTAGASARDIHADGLKVNERDKTREGKLSADITVGSASAKDIAVTNPALNAAGIDLSAVKVHREFDGKRAVADVFSAPGPTTVEVGSAAISGLQAGGVSLASANATGLAASTDGTNHQLAAKSASGTGLDVGGVHADTVSGQDFAARNGPDGSQVKLGSASAAGVKAGDVSLGSMRANGLDASQDKAGAVAASIAGATAKDAKVGDMQLGEIGAVQLTMAKNADILTAGAGRLSATGLQGGGATVAGASADGVTFSQGAAGTDVSAAGASASGIAAGGATVDGVGVVGPSYHRDAKGTQIGASSASVTGVKSGAGSVATAKVAAPSVTMADGATTAGASSLDATGVSAGGVNVASLGVTAPTLTTGPKGVSGGAKAITATDISGAARAKSAVAHNVTGGQAGGVTTAGAGDFAVSGLEAGGASVAQVNGTGASFSGSAAGNQVGAKTLGASGISAGNVSVADVAATDAHAATGGGKVNVGAGTLAAHGIAGGPVTAAEMRATGADVTLAGGDVAAKATTVDAKGVGAYGNSIDAAHGGNVSVNRDAKGTRVGVGSGTATGAKIGATRIGSAAVTDGHLAVGDGVTSIDAARASVANVATPDLTVGEANATGAAVRLQGDNATARARTVSGKKIAAGNTKVAAASASGVDVSKTAGGLHASAGELSASGIVTPGATVGAASATGADVNRTATSTRAKATTASADRVKAGAVEAGHLDASGIDASMTAVRGGTQTNAKVAGATGTGVSFRSGTTRAQADRLRAGATSLQTGPAGTSVDSAGLNASGVRVTTPGGVAPAGANDMADLSQLDVQGTVGLKAGTIHTGGRADKPVVQQAANLVDNAHLQASVPLKARTQGSGTKRVTTQAGTEALVEVQVSGGKLVPAGTKATFSKPLDTWGWTSVPGVYLSPDGKLYAAVSGLWDMNMSGDVNKALGGSGDKLPLSVSALASHSGTAPAPSTTQMSATLGQAPGANVASVNKDGDRAMTVNFSRLLLDALGVQTADAKIDVKGVTATGAGVAQDRANTTVTAGTVATGRTTVATR